MRIHSLTTRFVLTLLLSTAVPFLVFGWFVRGGMRERLEAQVVRVLLAEESEVVASRIDQLADHVERDCAQITLAARRALSERDSDAFEAELDLLPGFHSDFQLALLADDRGRALFQIESLSLDAPRRLARRALQPDDVTDRPWFIATVGDRRGIFWRDRHLSPLLHRNPDRNSLDPNEYSLGLGFLVVGDDGEIGAIYVLIHWQRFQDILDEAAERLRDEAGFAGARVELIGEGDRVLASSERSRYSSTVDSPTLVTALRTAVRATEVVHYESAGDAWLAGCARVGTVADRPFPWTVVVAAPETELFATSREFGNLILLVTATTAAILVLWSWFASRAILRPVRTLAEATTRIASGDLSTRVPARGRDELGDLGRSFNDMAEELTDNREQLRRAERQAAWAEMARQVAHEIKNPLTPMRMSAQLLQKARRENDPRLAELVDRLARTVLEQTDELARIASDFSSFAGTPERRLGRFDADALLRDVETDFAAVIESGAPRVEFLPGAEGAGLEADRAELRRVLMNLVQNALAAVGPDGLIEVMTVAQVDSVEFCVRDDGPGIDEEVAANLFEPYFTTRTSGTGLGLAICRRIVEAHGGSIGLTRRDDGHTEFCFTIPRA